MRIRQVLLGVTDGAPDGLALPILGLRRLNLRRIRVLGLARRAGRCLRCARRVRAIRRRHLLALLRVVLPPSFLCAETNQQNDKSDNEYTSEEGVQGRGARHR